MGPNCNLSQANDKLKRMFPFKAQAAYDKAQATQTAATPGYGSSPLARFLSRYGGSLNRPPGIYNGEPNWANHPKQNIIYVWKKRVASKYLHDMSNVQLWL